MNTAHVFMILVLCAFAAYFADGSDWGRGPYIAINQTALPLGLPDWMGG